MAIFTAFILFIAFFILSTKILSGGLTAQRQFEVSKSGNLYYNMDPLMFYLIFIIVTGPFFLVPPFTLAKYAVYFVSLLYILNYHHFKIISNWPIRLYWLFYFWLIIRSFQTPDFSLAGTLLIKYLLPVLSLYLGYLAFNTKYDLYFLLRTVTLWCIAYTFLIGGLSAKFYSWLYYSAPFANFLKYAGFADYLTSLFVLPLILAWWTGNKKWLWASALMFLSSLLEVVRTSLGGMFLVACTFYFFKYKFKSLPLIGGAIGIMLAVILFVPEVNQKFFGTKAGTVTVEAIANDDALSLDNIQTNGREFMWTIVENKCYKGHEIIGSGLGSAIHHLVYVRENIIKVPLLLHNDYVQIKCDTGIVGLGLFCSFLISVVYCVCLSIWNTKSLLLKFSGIMSAASFVGVAFSMGFDNVVSHSMTSLIMPFIFTGIFLKVKYLYENGEISE